MRQKNIHGYPLSVPSLGQTVIPGETIEHDNLLAGFEEISDEPEFEPDEKPVPGHAPDVEPTSTPVTELAAFTEPAPTTAGTENV